MSRFSISQKLWMFATLAAALMILQMLVVDGLARQIKHDMKANVDIIRPMIQNFHSIQISVIQTQQWLTDISAARGRDDRRDRARLLLYRLPRQRGFVGPRQVSDPVGGRGHHAGSSCTIALASRMERCVHAEGAAMTTMRPSAG